MSRIWLANHPMKGYVVQILKKYFSNKIVDRFMFMFEAELYDNQNTFNQLRDDKLIMEVRYKNRDTSEYICDVFSFMTKEQIEYKLLKYITDAYKAGKIGKDWVEQKGKLVSNEILSGKHETPDEKM